MRQTKEIMAATQNFVLIRNQRRLAPEAGLEPTTRRLTAGCSTIELLWNPRLAAQCTNVHRVRQLVSLAMHPDHMECGKPLPQGELFIGAAHHGGAARGEDFA